MIAQLTPDQTLAASPDTTAGTIQAASATAVKCACQEFRVNGFCEHLVYYAVAKIQAQRREMEPAILTKGG